MAAASPSGAGLVMWWVDSGSPGLGVLQLLKDEDPCAFAHDEAVPFLIEGDGGPVGVSRAGEGSHIVEARHGELGDGGFRAAGHAGVQVAVSDEPEGFAYGVGGGGAGRYRGEVGPLEAGADGDVPGGHVADHHGDEEHRHPARAFFQEFLVVFLKGLHPADAAADDDAHPVGVQVLQVGAAVPEGFRGGVEGELAVGVGAALLLAVQNGGGVEILDQGGHGDPQVLGVKTVDFGDSVAAGADAFPGRGGILAHGGNGSDAGNNNSSHGSSFSHMERQPETSSTCPEM